MFAGDRTLLERVEFSDGTEWTCAEGPRRRILRAGRDRGDDTVVGFQSDVMFWRGLAQMICCARAGVAIPIVYRPGDGAEHDLRSATISGIATGHCS